MNSNRYFQRALKTVKNDPEFKKLIIEEKDIATIYEYILRRDGFSASIAPKNYKEVMGLVGNTYHSSFELIDEIEFEKNRRKKQLKSFVSFSSLKKVFLKDCDKISISSSREKIYNYILETLKQYQETHTLKKGLYIKGQYKTGKSYLLQVLANELALLGCDVIYAMSVDMARVFKQNMFDSSLEGYINELKKVELLIVDDLGAESMTAWLRDDVYASLIMYRLNENKITYFSSNLSDENLAKHFTKIDGESTKAARLVSQIKALTAQTTLDDIY